MNTAVQSAVQNYYDQISSDDELRRNEVSEEFDNALSHLTFQDMLTLDDVAIASGYVLDKMKSVDGIRELLRYLKRMPINFEIEFLITLLYQYHRCLFGLADFGPEIVRRIEIFILAMTKATDDEAPINLELIKGVS